MDNDSRFSALLSELGIPTNDSEWHYVAISLLNSQEKSKIDKWLKDQRIFYFEKSEIFRVHQKWHIRKEWNTTEDIINKNAIFRFSNLEDAIHFKLTWS